MNRTDLSRALVQETGLAFHTVDMLVGRAFNLVGEELAAGREVTVASFGTFSARDRPARTGRNPRTGEPLSIPASRAATFKPAKALRERLNP
jgi:DNA-binding protein HU-beta